MSNVPMLPFTVILAGQTDYASEVTYYPVMALDASHAGDVAAEMLYDDVTEGWSQEARDDDPFERDSYVVLYVFAGHHFNLISR